MSLWTHHIWCSVYCTINSAHAVIRVDSIMFTKRKPVKSKQWIGTKINLAYSEITPPYSDCLLQAENQPQESRKFPIKSNLVYSELTLPYSDCLLPENQPQESRKLPTKSNLAFSPLVGDHGDRPAENLQHNSQESATVRPSGEISTKSNLAYIKHSSPTFHRNLACSIDKCDDEIYSVIDELEYDYVSIELRYIPRNGTSNSNVPASTTGSSTPKSCSVMTGDNYCSQLPLGGPMQPYKVYKDESNKSTGVRFFSLV